MIRLRAVAHGGTRRSSVIRESIWSIALVLGSIISSGNLLAQDVAGKLIGRVQDTSGGVIVNATVTAHNEETGIDTVVKTTSDGTYSFELLHVGSYRISAESAGFRRFDSPSNVIVAGKTITLLIALSPGSVTERVEVFASAAQVDTTTPTIQDSLSRPQLSSLPVIGRDARVNVELTQPGAVQAENGNNGSRVRVNGGRGASNDYQIDGTEANEYLTGNAAVLPAVENLQEYSIITSTAGAQYGNSRGSHLNAVIKSGTNELHGMGWTYFQNSAWNANSWEGNRSGTQRPSGTQRWYGGNLGGPVFIPKVYDGRAKTFWFFSFEYNNPSQQYLQQLRVLTNAERTGDFSQSSFGVPVINGQPTAQLDPKQFSPMAKAMLADPTLLPTTSDPNGMFSWLGSPKNMRFSCRCFAESTIKSAIRC